VKDKTYTGTLNGLYKKLVKKGSFNFYDYYEFNEELLHYFERVKKFCSINIFTSGSIQKNSFEVKERITNIFNNVFSAEDLELDKRNSRAYLVIVDRLKVKSEEIVFIDDQEENLKAARMAGLKTILYKNNTKLFADLERYFIS
jgi:FMN phosphatase YigB (HAD superfamily)